MLLKSPAGQGCGDFFWQEDLEPSVWERNEIQVVCDMILQVRKGESKK